jgi:hypothetical protein
MTVLCSYAVLETRIKCNPFNPKWNLFLPQERPNALRQLEVRLLEKQFADIFQDCWNVLEDKLINITDEIIPYEITVNKVHRSEKGSNYI